MQHLVLHVFTLQSRDIYMYIENRLAMINKMAASDLFYAQGSPSYGDSKGAKLKTLIKKIVFPSLRLDYSELVFRMWQKLVPFSAGANGE